MSAETTPLALAALLQAVQIGLAGAAINADVGAKWNTSPRDTQPPMAPMTERLRRAASNHFEGLILFTIAVFLVVIDDKTSAMTVALSWLYLLARVLYIPAYAFGWSPWRSVIWAVGFLSTIALIVITLV